MLVCTAHLHIDLLRWGELSVSQHRARPLRKHLPGHQVAVVLCH
jgi:hypothetical protein